VVVGELTSKVKVEAAEVMPTVDAAPPLVWPRGLLQPCRPPSLVYLDLNHWIYLAQAATGHAEGARHREALDACRAARATGTALFPLSAVHYFEIYKVRDPRQRRDVAAVMEELSGFATLLSRSTVMSLEVHAALDAAGEGPFLTGAVDLVGFGVGPALGMRGGLRVQDANERDVTDEFSTAGDGAAKLAAAELQLERALLAGPADTDLPKLIERG
jgi:hypothetical protein